VGWDYIHGYRKGEIATVTYTQVVNLGSRAVPLGPGSKGSSVNLLGQKQTFENLMSAVSSFPVTVVPKMEASG
jgi:hypothetical protein